MQTSTGAYLLVEIYGAEKGDDATPVFGDDGQMKQTERSAFTAMEKAAGWGEDLPEIIASGDWRYAVFSVEGEHDTGLNEASCLARRKPSTDTDSSFTYATLQQYAKAN